MPDEEDVIRLTGKTALREWFYRTARGTGWDSNYSENKVVVDVYEDEVYFAGVAQGGGSTDDPIIKSGKRGILADPLKAIKIEGLPAGKMRDWKRWKRDFLRRRSAEEGLPLSIFLSPLLSPGFWLYYFFCL